jgi:hypothetical protein
MNGKRKRQYSNSSNSNSLNTDNEDFNKNQVKLLFGDKRNIQHLLQTRETETKKLKLKEVIKTFYRFKNLENYYYANRLEDKLNANKVEIYKINYENENNINIQCYKGEFTIKTPNRQIIKYIREDEEDVEEVINYQIFSNDRVEIGDDIDFFQYGYLNETGTCFYLIENPNFFYYLKTLFPDVNISDDPKNIGI